MRRAKVYFVGVGELDAQANGYLGRWESFRRALQRSAIDSELITTDFVHSRRTTFAPDSDSITALRCGGYKRNISLARFIYNVRFVVKAYFSLRSRVKDGDAVIVINSIPPELTLLLLLFRQNIHWVFDVRDVWPPALARPPGMSAGVAIRLWGWWCKHLNRVAIQRSALTMITSTRYLDDLDIPRGKALFIPLGYDPERWSFADRRKSNPGADPIAGYIGNWSNQYDLELVMATLSAIGTRIELIGAFPHEFVSAHPEAIFHGHLRPEDQTLVVQRWSMGVIPDLQASGPGLPNKLFDYIGARLPVVVVKRHRELSELDHFVLERDIGILLDSHGDNSAAYTQFRQRLREGYFETHIDEVRQHFSRDALSQEFVERVASMPSDVQGQIANGL